MLLVIYLYTLNEVRVKLHNIYDKLLRKNRLFYHLNLSMFRAVRQVTVYIPATALQSDIVTYKHVVIVLHASDFLVIFRKEFGKEK
jgi:hypothetical protein